MDAIESGRQILRLEIKALEQVFANMGSEFRIAVGIMDVQDWLDVEKGGSL